MKVSRKLVLVLVVVSVLTFGTVGVYAFDVGNILKLFGVGYLVKMIAEPLNDFINGVTFNRGVGTRYATKVVPIVSVGQGGYIGAAQVTGTRGAVDRVKSVAQVEATFQGLRVKILIPIDSINPLSRFRRVQGVGVSAVVDIRL